MVKRTVLRELAIKSHRMRRPIWRSHCRESERRAGSGERKRKKWTCRGQKGEWTQYEIR
jgi:hypothetical protein